MPGKKRTKAERFRDEAQKRVTNALKALRAVEELADRKRFGFDAEQVDAMGTALHCAVVKVEKRFAAELEKEEPAFEF